MQRKGESVPECPSDSREADEKKKSPKVVLAQIQPVYRQYTKIEATHLAEIDLLGFLQSPLTWSVTECLRETVPDSCPCVHSTKSPWHTSYTHSGKIKGVDKEWSSFCLDSSPSIPWHLAKQAGSSCHSLANKTVTDRLDQTHG